MTEEVSTLRDHTDDVDSDFGEPEGGWESSTPRFTNEILSIMLCSFTAQTASVRQIAGRSQIWCRHRVSGLHPDVDCIENFFAASAIEEALIPTDQLALLVTLDPEGDIVYQGLLEPVADSDSGETA